MCVCSPDSKRDPQLWVQALSYFASREDCKAQISEVLQYIEEEHLMQPLMVVKLLAENRQVYLCMVPIQCVCCQSIARMLIGNNSALNVLQCRVMVQYSSSCVCNLCYVCASTYGRI